MGSRSGVIGLFLAAGLLAACGSPQTTVPATATNPAAGDGTTATGTTAPSTGAAVTATATATDTSARVVTAANTFVSSLNETQRSQAVFEYNNTTAKAQWSNLPRGLFNWAGVRTGDLNQSQKQAAMDLLSTALSREGYARVLASVNADEVLKNESGNNPLQFGADNYFVAVFGTPSTTAPWMFRFGGHHITVNATIVGSNIAITPSFPGCQPCEFTANNQSTRVTGDVTDRAFTLVNALDASQRQQAVLGTQVIDLVLGPQQQMRTIPPEGLKASAMNSSQQAMLVDLIAQYVNILNEEDAAQKMNEVQGNLADTYFAWYGPTNSGSAAYFRIQGPTLWIEFSPQGGGGPGGTGLGGAASANHIHAIFRDPTNEYGVKWAP